MGSLKKIPSLILSHPNTDFDAFASMLAAQLLYPGSYVCLHAGPNRNVKEYFNLHSEQIPHIDLADTDPGSLERVVLIEVGISSKLGVARSLVEDNADEVVIFDHHPGGKKSTDANQILGSDGSLVTTMLKLLTERGIEISSMLATAFALGIHEDTGSLTFPSTTEDDVAALAFCMKAGANQQMLARYLRKPLSDKQRELIVTLVDNRKVVDVAGMKVIASWAKRESYVEDVSGLASRVGDIVDWDALVICVEMESRTFVVGRSRNESINAADVLRTVGGGGHAQAASALVREMGAEEVMKKLLKSAEVIVKPATHAREIMSKPVMSVGSDQTINDTLVELQHRGHSGAQVAEDGVLVGSVMREDLDRALRHNLGHAPVKAVMSADLTVAGADTPASEIRLALSSGTTSRVVVTDTSENRCRTVYSLPEEQSLGVVTRGDILRALHEVPRPSGPEPNAEASMRFIEKMHLAPSLEEVLPAIQAAGATEKGVYLVGGAVRDVLLGMKSLDLDIMVEGDAIGFASRLAKELAAHSHAHTKFHTAAIKGRLADGSDLRIDVASARTEFYEHPGAMPKVQRSTLERDLARRDFTVNSMAASLKAEDLGSVYDFFGGLKDLDASTLRVLHNLSFIEDPTRLFRAFIYESRLGFKMEPRTLSLARGCVEMKLLGDLESERLRDELMEILGGDNLQETLERMNDLGVDSSMHPQIICDEQTVDLVNRIDPLLEKTGRRDEVRRDLMRLALLVRHMPAEDIFVFLNRLKFNKKEQDTVASTATVPAKLATTLSKEGLAPSELHSLLKELPVEALITTELLGDEAKHITGYLGAWFKVIRHVRLEIGGDDLIKEGLQQSPTLGRALDETLHLKIDGFVKGRKQELETAIRLARRELSEINE